MKRSLTILIAIAFVTIITTICGQSFSKARTNASRNSPPLTQQDSKDLTVLFNLMVQRRLVATATIYFSGNKSRVVGAPLVGSGEGSDRIRDFALERVITVDHGKREFYDNSFAEIKNAMQKQGAKQSRKDEKAAKDNPEIEQFLRSEASKINANYRQNAKTIVGYKCNQATMSMGDSLKIDVWTSEELPAPPFFDAGSSLSIHPIIREQVMKMYEEMEKPIKGLMLGFNMAVNVQGDQIELSLEAKEVKRDKIPQLIFEVPPGYKKKKGLPKHIAGFIN